LSLNPQSASACQVDLQQEQNWIGSAARRGQADSRL
jgi:hypothetical protein